MIDIYCERVLPGFWDEPLNAVSNAAFLVAAALAWRDARRRGVLDARVGGLIGLIAAIGLGSFLFHTLATGWALAADVVPILLFQVSFLWIYGRSVIGWSAPAATLGVAGLVTALLFSGRFGAYLNGSLGYAPALFALAMLGLHHVRRVAVEPPVLLVAAALLCVSLGFRSVDLWACDTVPVGTHFVWHLLNGVVLYLSMRGLTAGMTARLTVARATAW